MNAHDLLPMPYTDEALRHVAERVWVISDFLERPVFLENPSSYVEFTTSTWEEEARGIKPSARMAPEERLDIYRGMYEARPVEALRVDYHTLERFLGEDVFGELAEMYVRGRTLRGAHAGAGGVGNGRDDGV